MPPNGLSVSRSFGLEPDLGKGPVDGVRIALITRNHQLRDGWGMADWLSVGERLSTLARPVHSDPCNHPQGDPMTTQHPTSTLDHPTEGAETHPLTEAGQHVTESAVHLAERAASIGLQQADRGREFAADGIDKVAGTVRRVSTDMQADQPQIANAALTAADQAEKVAQYLRQTDARQMIANVEDVARRQPLIFLGGAFLLGVAASRFIKAAGGGQGNQDAQSGYRSGYSSDYRSGGTSDYRRGGFEATGPGTSNGNEGF